MKARIAVIGGTGLENTFLKGKKILVGTPYGPSTVMLLTGLASQEILFLPRHGEKHSLPPHKINYRANIWALHSLGIERVIAHNAVGAINPNLQHRSFLVPSDFIDFTRCRASTFYDEAPVTHIDVTNIYCPELRAALIKACQTEGVPTWMEGVYVCTEGPRYESPAEVRMFRSLGCDVVGMTGLPEAVLSRELGLCYASICYITNMAAGLGPSISAEEISAESRQMEEKAMRIILNAVEAIPKKRNCQCYSSLEGARV